MVIIIALIILVVGVLILSGYILPTGENVNLQNELKECCQKYRAFGCPEDPNRISEIQCAEYDLWTLHYEKLNILDVCDLKELCACPPDLLCVKVN